jgi:hypothetical protein
MIVRVLTDKWTADKAIAEAVDTIKRIKSNEIADPSTAVVVPLAAGSHSALSPVSASMGLD